MADIRSSMWRFDWRRGLGTALAALAMLTTQALAADAQGRVPRPVIEAADGKACVADPAFMRKNHMDILKHQRDDSVRQGIRAPKFSLNGCITCHASKKTNSVAASGENFCRSCHSYTGVSLDCFECHSATPGGALATATGIKP